MAKQISLRLILDVTYELNGIPKEDLKYFLADIAKRAADEGLFTHDTPAEVTSWDYQIMTNFTKED